MPQNNKVCLMAAACGIVTVMVLVIVISFASSSQPNGTLLIISFPEFKEKFNRKYENVDEENMRKKIFEKNLEYIKNHNQLFEAGQVGFNLAVNRHADMSNDEFRKTVLQSSNIPVIQYPGNTEVYSSRPSKSTPKGCTKLSNFRSKYLRS